MGSLRVPRRGSGYHCGELSRQHPHPESFAAGEAPQSAGGRGHGGDTALALGPPPLACAAPPRPEESAVSRIPRAPLWAVFTLPPASGSLQRSPRPRPAAATPTDGLRGGGGEDRPSQKHPARRRNRRAPEALLVENAGARAAAPQGP